MNRLWRASAALLFLILAACPVSAAGITLFMGPSQVTGLPEPVVVGTGVLVPAELLRYTGVENLDVSAGRLSFRTGTNEVVVKAGDTNAIVNGSPSAMGGTALLENGTLFVPLSFLANVLGLRISWDQQATAIRLSSKVSNSTKVEAKPGLPVLEATLVPPIPSPVQYKPQGATPESTVKTSPPMQTTTPSSSLQGSAIKVPVPGLPEPNIHPPQETGAASQVDRTVVPNDLPSGGEKQNPQVTTQQWSGIGKSSLQTQISLQAGVLALTLMGVKAEDLDISLIPAPNRLVIDLANFMPLTNLEPWPIDHQNVARLRVAPYRGKGRLVLDLVEPTGYLVESVENGVRITLNRVLHQISFAAAPIGGELCLDLPSDTKYDSFRLPIPNRFVIDIPHTTLNGQARHIRVDSEMVKAVRVNQNNPHTVRVVLDLVEDIPEPSRIPGQSLQLLFHSEVQKVGVVDLQDGRQVIVVEGKGRPEGKLFRLRNPDRVVLDLANTWSSTAYEEQSRNEGLVHVLRAAQFDSKTFRIVAEVGAKADARLISLDTGTVGILVEAPLLQNTRIVVDAGHGGSAPGAIGKVIGLRESDVNLDIALQLETLLLRSKAAVGMVRSDNSSVFLADRPAIAAAFEADFFISIHANSTSAEQKASGTETYYWHEGNGSVELARAIQEELVSVIGTNNRGVKKADLLVLRESAIPAVLVEVAFLSHPEDEAKLADAAFRRQVAEGLFNGIVRYVQQKGGNYQTQSTETSPDLLRLIKQSDKRMYLPIRHPEPAIAGAHLSQNSPSEEGPAPIVESTEPPQAG